MEKGETQSMVEFILASASPRRKRLLEQMGARFVVAPVDVDETPFVAELPEDYVVRVARDKASRAFALGVAFPVLAADTCVVFDGHIMGKPKTEVEALDMLAALSGNTHRVLTAVVMAGNQRIDHRLSITEVTFAPITAEQRHRYWQTGEPMDKAGAYAIQGFGAVFVERIEGSYSGVVGLPLAQTRELLELFGVSYWNPI